MKKKIFMGLFVLATVIGMGFAEETKSTSSYYYGYNQATSDYSKDNDYNPSWCNNNYDDYGRKKSAKDKYDCIKGYQESWKDNSNAAPKIQTENTDSNE